MAKFKKKVQTTQSISTASLPDIVFILLFFFMVTTTFKKGGIMVKQNMPKASQLIKIEKKSLVSYIYVGIPNSAFYGKEPKIQINDVFVEPKDIIQWVNQEKDKLSEAERDQLTITLKVDIESKMGIVDDVQQQLREANARKILYSSILLADKGI